MQLMQRVNYFAMIENAVGTTMFRNLYAESGGAPLDLLDNGTRSCAVFVSSILVLFKLLPEQCATVNSLEHKLMRAGWAPRENQQDLQVGDIIVWEPRLQNGHRNRHVGFYIGGRFAISNDWRSRRVQRHHFMFGRKGNGEPVRRIEAVFAPPDNFV